VLEFINFHIIPGLILGSIYALGAIGITLVFGILRYAHFAHGDMATLGAFLVLLFIGLWGIDPWVALPLAMIATALVAVGVDKLFYEPLRSRPKIIVVMASLGVALMIRAIIQILWGTDPQSYVRGIVRPDTYFGLLIRPRELWTLLAVVVIVVSLEGFLRFSRWGKAMRAMSDNPDLARLSGVNLRHVTMLTWCLVGALCAASGMMLGINTEVHSMMGWHLLLPMFAAAILGGVGRVEGAVLGGLVVGLAEELSTLVMPAQYKSATAFVILILMLLWRPRGLLRGKVL
jgi:branched-chain amino acid transport system permease protein